MTNQPRKMHSRLTRVFGLALLLAGAIGGCRAPGAGADVAVAMRPQALDTILADSGGVLVGLMADSGSRRLVIGVRGRDGVNTVYTSDRLPAIPEVTLGAIGDRLPGVLWSFEDERLVGAALMRVWDDSARVIYQRFHPDKGLCARPRLTMITGRAVLVEERAGVFAVGACVDPAEDCVWQFTSTWPVPFKVVGDSVLEAKAEFRGLYRDRAKEFRDWARRIRQGALVEGQNLRAPETIKRYCGAAVLDSLDALASRAERIAEGN